MSQAMMPWKASAAPQNLLGHLFLVVAPPFGGGCEVADLLRQAGAAPRTPKSEDWISFRLELVHRMILAEAGPEPLDEQGAAAMMRRYRKSLLDALAFDHTSLDRAVLDDPQLCQLLRVWVALARKRRLFLQVVLPVMSPAAISAGLSDHDKRGVLARWTKLTAAAEEQSRDLPRSILLLEEGGLEARRVLDAISTDLGTGLPLSADQTPHVPEIFHPSSKFGGAISTDESPEMAGAKALFEHMRTLAGPHMGQE